MIDLLQPFWIMWAAVFFAGIAIWASSLKSKARIESYGRIPLKDSDKKSR